MEQYQEIIALIIVGIAASIGGYKLYRKFTNPLSGCSGCASDCSGCQLQDLKREIEENKRRKETRDRQFQVTE